MANKILQVRLQEKIDTLDHWLALDADDNNAFVPLAGEKINVKVPTDINSSTSGIQRPDYNGDGAAAGNGDGEIIGYEIITKTGDGTTRFKELPWDSALAADVYDWAKAATKPSYSIGEITGRQELSISGAGTKVVSYDGDTADSLNIVGEGLITITPDTEKNQITIKTTANNYSLPAAGASLGGVKTGGDVTINSGVITVNHATSADNAAIAGQVANSLVVKGNGTAVETFNGSAAGEVNFVPGNNVTITTADGKITIASTNTDTKVTQNAAITTDKNYPVILGYSDATTSVTDTVNKAAALTYNPKTQTLSAPIVVSTTADIGDNSTRLATTAFVANEIASKLAANDAMIFKGTLGTGGTVTALPDTHNAGWTYRVITAGTYAGIKCEVGDLIICITDGTAANNAHWTVAQTNIDGAVTGPTSATANGIALFNGTTGKIIKNSSKTIVTSITGSANVPTDGAVKAYVDDKTITANATDDDIIVLTGTSGASSVSYDAKHAKKGPSTTADTTKGPSSGLTINTTTTSGSIVIPKITVDSYGHTTGLTEQTLSIALPTNYKIKQEVVSTPEADGNTTSFIDTIYQNANGEITITKKTVSGVTTSAAGLMSAADKTKLNGIATGANKYSLASSGAYTDSNATYTFTLTPTVNGTAGTAMSLKVPTMVGATSSAASKAGLVPVCTAANRTKFLRGDGTWVTPTNTTYNDFTTTARGLVNPASTATAVDGKNDILFNDHTWHGADDYIVLCAGSASVNV